MACLLVERPSFQSPSNDEFSVIKLTTSNNNISSYKYYSRQVFCQKIRTKQ